jgi:hypothetical protein
MILLQSSQMYLKSNEVNSIVYKQWMSLWAMKTGGG